MKRPCLSVAGRGLRDKLQRLVILSLAGFGTAAISFAGNNDLGKIGTEVAVGSKVPGEQTGARVSLSSTGGFVLFQSNAIDADGYGIAAVRLNAKWEPVGEAFKVNSDEAGDQESPEAAVSVDGSVFAVWRSNVEGKGSIRGRLVDSAGNPKTPELQINPEGSPDCLTPVVARLQDGSFCVAWAQRELQSSMQDVWFQRLNSTGQPLGNPTLANQYSYLNQRSPGVAPLANGGFVLVWVSEEQTGNDSVDVFSRVFDNDGTAVSDETQLNSGINACANPAVATDGGGKVAVAWSDLLPDGSRRSWDVNYRVLGSNGDLLGAPKILNTHSNGRQYRPRIAPSTSGFIIAWTSFGQDGWDEGVFARVVGSDGLPQGDELQVNTQWKGRQFEPSIASAPSGQALVVWSSYSSATANVGLVAQAIGTGASNLDPLPVPYVNALTATRIGVAWPAATALNIASYEIVFDNGAAESTANNFWTSKPLTPSSTHTVRLGYVLTDGRRGPLTEMIEATTWGEDSNGDGLPDDWQALYWGDDSASWPVPTADTDRDGTDNRSEFLASTSPINPASNLKLNVTVQASETTLRWSTVPGNVYQVLSSPDLKSWQPLGQTRFASGESDLIQLSSTSQMSFYRVTRVR